MVTTITFTIPNEHWLSSNQRLHWGAKAKRALWLRKSAGFRGLALPRFSRPVHVTAHIGYATNGRADMGNSAPTVKALIDGIVDSGVLAEDDSKHLIGPDYRRDPEKAPRGFHTVRLEIVEVCD